MKQKKEVYLGIKEIDGYSYLTTLTITGAWGYQTARYRIDRAANEIKNLLSKEDQEIKDSPFTLESLATQAARQNQFHVAAELMLAAAKKAKNLGIKIAYLEAAVSYSEKNN